MGTMKSLFPPPKLFDLDFYLKNALFRKQRAKVEIACFTVAVTLSLEEAISKLNISDTKKISGIEQLAGRVWYGRKAIQGIALEAHPPARYTKQFHYVIPCSP